MAADAMTPNAELVMPAIRWDPQGGFAPAGPAIAEALALGVGGFIIFGGERAAVRVLTDDITARAPHPLLIASDLERGAGQQVRGLTPLPPLLALAGLGEPAVREAARLTAREARAVGINWIFAPDVDLDIEPANPIIQTRSFGADPARVGALAAAWIESCQAEGVLACAKHFPGHGRTTGDSHDQLPVVAADTAALEADLAPFKAAVAAGVASIMTAHVAYPALDPSGVSATYSAPILTGLLRGAMRFDGLVVTDALIMKGALTAMTEEEGAVRALAAGCDLLLYPEDVAGVVRAIAAAIENGTLPRARVKEALARRRKVLAWLAGAAKAGHGARAGSAAGGPEGLSSSTVAAVPDPAGAALARTSLQVLRGRLPRLTGTVTVEIVDDDAGLPYPLPSRDVFAAAIAEHGLTLGDGGTRVVLLFADVKSGKGSATLKPAIRRELESRLARPAVVVLLGHPRRLAEIPGDHTVLCAFSGDEVMQRAAASLLTG